MYSEQIESRKFKIHRIAVSIDNSENEDAAVEILRVLKSWNWQLSACDFFHVDRTMLNGVNK